MPSSTKGLLQTTSASSSDPLLGASNVRGYGARARRTEATVTFEDSDDSEVDATGNTFDNETQAGVRRVEATTAVWSKTHLVAAYANIWFIYFIISIEEVVVGAMEPFVTSAFEKHSLTAAVEVMSSIIGGVTKIPIAKILDTWGRPQGLALTLLIWVIGLAMMAACQNVETFAAAKVFSSVGSQGVTYCLTIFIADTSSLLNRPLMLAFASSPYVITTWIGGPVSESILSGPGWRWGFGIWTIVTPAVVLPLSALFLWNDRKAELAGIIEPRTGRITLRDVKKYAVDVDLVGLLIFAAGMALFLLPFNIWSYQEEQWRSPLIIFMITAGTLLIVTFVLWEKYLAPVKFVPVRLLMDRTVFSAGIMFIFVFGQSSIWGSFFTSMLLVVWDTSVTEATYIHNIYRVGSCLAGIMIGLIVHRVGRFKWIAAYYSIPLSMLGVGLLIKFRQASEPLGYVVLCQILVAFAGGPTVLAGEMAMMAPSDHQHVAVLMAILNFFCSVGSAVGSSASSAIWTGTFRRELVKNLPPGAPVDEIYGDLEKQLSYPVGSAIRNGIARAYSVSQRYMLIASVSLLACAWVCTWFWRDIKLKKVKQVKGTVA
ncbi:tetratricopeptide-like helical [Purpureocillium lavendulum]|uniref:Tetratricopeptide-like helical n=1 Tax=Purpureocillium lavendulum TaxID=1247861 RepID=A0AB34FM54_9HYPO|nr:tetratricopeptide-like helical [Purpureocillium lavendulum]